MSAPLSEITGFLERLAPLSLAESWDNVGLLLGDPTALIERAMTCLTLTLDVADEAIAERVGLVVSHHPLLFRPVQRIVADDPEGRLLRSLIQADIAVYSPHTAYDSAATGINQQLAETLGLAAIAPLRPAPDPADGPGSGRWGVLQQPVSLEEFLEGVRTRLPATTLQFVGDPRRRIERAAVACGAAAEFLPDAQRVGCDLLLTGEARFHACLDARTRGVALVVAGHYATERPGVERLAATIQDAFPALQVHASRRERDPLEGSVCA